MDTLIRIAIALSLFTAMIAWERLLPRRKLILSRGQRWPVNLGLAAFNIVIMRLTIGGLAYAGAVYATEQHYGLLNLLPAPSWLAITLSLLILDFAIYSQHVASHQWPWLWRLHQVHHTDMEFDTTTAVRFHPLEIMVSMVFKVLVIILLGAHPAAVVAFEIILNGAALFNHSNIELPETWDKKLRWLIVTPDMHRIHHSTLPAETDSNYGFSISCWDRLCRTYTAQPKSPQTEMAIGLTAYRNHEELNFVKLLLLPLQTLKR